MSMTFIRFYITLYYLIPPDFKLECTLPTSKKTPVHEEWAGNFR